MVATASLHPWHICPLAVCDPAQIPRLVEHWRREVERCGPAVVARLATERFIDESSHAAVIVGRTSEELQHELQLLDRTWERCQTERIDWRTPLGSYFSPQPLGRSGRLAFVYPGIGSIYPGFSRGLLETFPGVLDELPHMAADELLSLFHPDLLWRDTPPDADFYADVQQLAEMQTSQAYVWTHILRTGWGIEPQLAFGNSLGEIAMFASCGAWRRPQVLCERLRESPVFRTRLGGPMTLLNEWWPQHHDPVEHWSACVLPFSATELHQQLAGLPPKQCWMTQCNSEREVVAVGDREAVQRLYRAAGRRGEWLPFRLVYHCDLPPGDAAELQRCFESEVAPRGSIEFLSSSPFTRIPHDAVSIARALLNTATHAVNFPELVQTAYSRGARVFVEVGPRSSCTSWIRACLGNRPHVATSIDQRGAGLAGSLVRMLAVLIAHRVPLAPAQSLCSRSG